MRYVAGGAVTSTGQGAFFSTYSVTSPTSGGRDPPTPPSTAPPFIRVGGSPPITITSTPRRRASSTIPAPTLRARITVVSTSTDSYSSPTSFARLSARLASSTRPGGGG